MEKHGDLLDCKHTYLVHQTNCESPYARGVAQLVFAKYPFANTYVNRKTTRPGTIDLFREPRGIVNLNAQLNRGKPNTKDDTKEKRLVWFQACLDQLFVHLVEGDSVAFPFRIGCNLGGGYWPRYRALIKTFGERCLTKKVTVEVLNPFFEDNTLRILVCGDRNYRDGKLMETTLECFVTTCKEKEGKKVTIIHGGCKGADTLAGLYAKKKQFHERVFPAQWNTYGRAAGPIRNYQMIDQKPHVVIAFHKDFENSKGTRSMVKIALEKKVETYLVATDGKLQLMGKEKQPTMQKFLKRKLSS